MDTQMIISAAWSLVAGVCGYGWYHSAKQLRQWRALERNQARRNYELQAQVNEIRGLSDQRPLETVSADIARTITELQNENAQLRGDVETGCRLIDRQREKLTEQTKLLNKFTGESRRLLGQLKGRKR
jgi:hypothetical protein